MAKKVINRLKVVLAEQGRTNKWLAEKLDKNTATISRWCTNEMQPSLESLLEIAETLNVDVRKLLVSTESKTQID
jgi:transcriptional regulator with XRE-family HTH domain